MQFHNEQANKLLLKVTNLFLSHFATRKDGASLLLLPSSSLSPLSLSNVFSQHNVSLQIAEKEEAFDLEQLRTACELTLKQSVQTSHPLFLNQLYGRPDVYGVCAEMISLACNTNVHTFEVAPVFTMMESEVVSKWTRIIGGEYRIAREGLHVPGGSISNMYGMHLARFNLNPLYKTKGMSVSLSSLSSSSQKNLVAFTSAESHYSYLKMASLLGIGTDNLIKIKCDEKGSMDVKDLEEKIRICIASGDQQPFFVGSTAGTTVRGAFDPFSSINEICRKYNIWHHIDACWGGAVLFSKKYRHLMFGVEESDSLSWNPHKMLGMPLQCSLFVTRHKNILNECNSTKAEYLFQPDKENSEMDIGDKTIQCGRKADAIKMWLAFKAYGDEGIETLVDYTGHLSEYFVSILSSNEQFKHKFLIASPPQFANICFWYLPSRFRSKTFDPRKLAKNSSEWQDIHSIAPKIKVQMQRSGRAMIGFQPHGDWPNMFRLVLPSSATISESHLVEILMIIDEYGDKL